MTSSYMAKVAAVTDLLGRYVRVTNVGVEFDGEGLVVALDGKLPLAERTESHREAHRLLVEAADTVLDVVEGSGCLLLYDCTRITGFEADIRLLVRPPKWQSAEEIAAYVHVPRDGAA